MTSSGSSVRSVDIRMSAPRRGWRTKTKRTSWPSPEQVARGVRDLDIALVIHGAGSGGEAALLVQECLEPELLSVLPGPSRSAATPARGERVRHGIAAYARDEMVTLREQGTDHLAAGVVGVGDQDDPTRDLPGHLEEELHQAVQQGSAKLAGGVDHPLVDARGERHRGDAPVGGAHELRQGLEGGALDPLPLRVVGGLLMQLLDPGHLPALLGDLEAIGQADPGSPHLERVEVALAEADPEGRQGRELERFAVEEVQQP